MKLRALIAAVAACCLIVVTGASGSAGGAAPAPVTVRLGEFFFRPRAITVHVDQKVRFLNVGKIEHTVADTDSKGSIRSKLIRPRPLRHGDVQVVRLAKPGVVYYLCTFHPTLMKGRITVTR